MLPDDLSLIYKYPLLFSILNTLSEEIRVFGSALHPHDDALPELRMHGSALQLRNLTEFGTDREQLIAWHSLPASSKPLRS